MSGCRLLLLDIPSTQDALHVLQVYGDACLLLTSSQDLIGRSTVTAAMLCRTDYEAVCVSQHIFLNGVCHKRIYLTFKFIF